MFALAFTGQVAFAEVPDRGYVIRWLGSVFPEAVIDGNTVYIIDGLVYDEPDAEQVLDRRSALGAHISYVNYVEALKVYTALHTGVGNGSGFVFIGTRPQPGKIKRRAVRQFNREPEAFCAVQVGLCRLTPHQGRRFIGSLRRKHIQGVEVIEPGTGTASTDGTPGKLLVIWIK